MAILSGGNVSWSTAAKSIFGSLQNHGERVRLCCASRLQRPHVYVCTCRCARVASKQAHGDISQLGLGRWHACICLPSLDGRCVFSTTLPKLLEQSLWCCRSPQPHIALLSSDRTPPSFILLISSSFPSSKLSTLFLLPVPPY